MPITKSYYYFVCNFIIITIYLFIIKNMFVCNCLQFILHLDIDNFSTYLSSLFVSTSANDNVGQIKKRMSEYQNIPLEEVKKEFDNFADNKSLILLI